MKLYGREWKRRELEARVGRLDQVAGIQRLMGVEGPEAGNEHISVRTGAGLTYTVMPMRGLDIHQADFGGTPISWVGPNGTPHPSYYDSKGLSWFNTAAGGLLMTCGLTQVGSPVQLNREELGLHGRVHHIPARQVAAETIWQGDEGVIRIAGLVEERRIFGHQVCLRREIRSPIGENRIEIHDSVENCGFEPAPHMILYHFNFGFPLLTEMMQVVFPSGRVRPRETVTPLENLDRWQTPVSGYRERVYYHENLTSDNGWTEVQLTNPQFPIAGGLHERPVTVKIRWEVQNLPRFVQWKMPGAGTHVLGIEPANCHVEGRLVEESRGTLVILEPGEQRDYRVEIIIDS